jgi:hypothetical protein
MKALTVYQPEGDLIMMGAKQWVFRKGDYRDQIGEGDKIVIHASAREIRPLQVETMIEKPRAHLLIPDLAVPYLRRILMAPSHVLRSMSLGTAVLGPPRRLRDIFNLSGDTPADPAMWAWRLNDIEPFAEPVSRRGAAGFWDWPEDEPVEASPEAA